MSDLTPEQAEAVERRTGSLLVRAGAGTGKTTVLVERFVRAVLDDGVAVESILAITFTEKAAQEMKGRVRRRFLDLGRREEARAAESAWISTIHGLCSRMLRAHALSAGIDPGFRVLDQIEAERLALDAFDGALEAFMGEGEDPERIEMVAAHTPDRLRDMVRTVHSHLRSRGQRRPALEDTHPPAPAGEHERLEAAAREALAELALAPPSASVTTAIGCLEAALELLGSLPAGTAPEATSLDDIKLKGSAKAVSTEACEEYRSAHGALRSLALAQREARDHASAALAARPLRRALRTGQARALGARLRGPRAGGPRPAGRRRGTARGLRRSLQPRAGGRVPGHQPAPERAARAAVTRQPLSGRGREPVDLPLPQRRCGRLS